MCEYTGYRTNYQNLQYEDVVSLFDTFAVGRVGGEEVIAVCLTGERNLVMIFHWLGDRYALKKKGAEFERPLSCVELKKLIAKMNC